jgi:hypothetical protein
MMRGQFSLTTRLFPTTQTCCKLLGLRYMILRRLVARRALHIGTFLSILDIHRGGFTRRARRNFKLLLATTFQRDARRLRADIALAVRGAQRSKQTLLISITDHRIGASSFNTGLAELF